MENKFRIDSLDKKILGILMKDARVPYLEVARQCKVSGAAVHQRIQKMTEAGVITGSQFNISPYDAGYLTQAFIGLQVNLTSTRTHEQVFDKISRVPEVVECHHTTGKYSLFVKIMAKNNQHLKSIIIEKIQSILEVTATETFISLEEGFKRQLPIQ
ncbi:MAG: transcriptional regulator [Marinilabiliales bacterium]|nr:MAG: transcriptional regulator [Marinilabiliales bacterium]